MIRALCRTDSDDDEGSALIETVVVIFMLLIPLIWISVAMMRVEAAAMATKSAAREAARVYVTSASGDVAPGRAALASRMAFEDQDAPVGQTSISCTTQPCLTPGASVTAASQTVVPLPFVPRWLASATHLQITVNASRTELVERYGGQR